MVQWTAEKDQLLLRGVFQFCDIKSSAPLLAYLTEIIGGDCTPKAVSHRLANIRNSGRGAKSNGDGTNTPKATKNITPRSTVKGKGKTADNAINNEEGITPTPTPKPKRKRASCPSKRDLDARKAAGEEEEEKDEEEIQIKRIKSEPLDFDESAEDMSEI